MSVEIKVERMENLSAALKRHRDKMAKRWEKALPAGMEVLHEAVGEIVPMETGNMWETSYVRSDGYGFSVVAVMAFTADYSVFVHEDLSKAHGEVFNAKYAGDASQTKGPHAPKGMLRRPQEQAKFIEDPMRNPLVLDVMAGVIRRWMMGVQVTVTAAAKKSA